MKKLISGLKMTRILAVFLFTLPLLLEAQNQPFSLGIHYGYSLPLGQFASHEFKREGKEYGAYALMGSTFSAEAGWQVFPHLGICANFSQSYFPIASGYYVKDKKNDDPAVEELWIKSGPYEVRTYMLGAHYRYPISERFAFTAKGMGGILWAMAPDQLYAARYFFVGNLYWSKTSAISSKPSFLTGMNFTYKLFDHVELLMDAEYSYARSVFSYWNTDFTVRTDKELKMPIFRLQTGLHLTF